MASFFLIAAIGFFALVTTYFIWKVIANKKQFEQAKLADDPYPANVRAAKKLDLKREELEVLYYLSEGYSNQEIANKTSLPINTVNSSVRLLFDKLGVTRRSMALTKARSLKLIP